MKFTRPLYPDMVLGEMRNRVMDRESRRVAAEVDRDIVGCGHPGCRTMTHQVNDDFCPDCRAEMARREQQKGWSAATAAAEWSGAGELLRAIERTCRTMCEQREALAEQALTSARCPTCGGQPKRCTWVILSEVPVEAVARAAGSELRLAVEAYRIHGPLRERLQCMCDRGHEWYPGDSRPTEEVPVSEQER